MSLKEQIQVDVKEALKAHDSNKRVVLGSLLSAMKNRELEKRSKLSKAGTTGDLAAGSQLTDEEALEVVGSEIKKRKESIETYAKGGRPELAASEKSELNLLMQYLPEQLSEDEVRTYVKSAISEVNPQGIKDMGKVIGAVMPHVKGKTDGQTVSRIVKEELENASAHA